MNHFLICCFVQNAPLGPRQCPLRHTADIVCCDTQQTCLLCDTTDMSAVSHSKHVCCVRQQTCLLHDTADMSAVSGTRHVCSVAQQTCRLCDTADMSTVSHGKHVCCVRQQTCLLRGTADTVWCVTQTINSAKACRPVQGQGTTIAS